ncbi:MAG: site-specific integrase [Erysipelothrix sp.]
MAKKLRKEKYIKNRIGRDGKQFFQVSIEYWNDEGSKQQYNKSFNEKDYDSPSAALDAACIHRNDILVQVKGNRRKPDIRSLKKDYTVQELYNKSKELLPLSIKTFDRLDALFKECIFPYKDMKIIDVTVSDIQICLNELINTCSDDKINRIMSIWRRIYLTGNKLDVVARDCTLAVTVPKSKVPQKQIEVMTDIDTIHKVIDALRKYTKHSDKQLFNTEIYIYVIKTLYYTGMRPSECYALTKEDVNFESKTISISKRVGSTTEKKQEIVATKTANAVRVLPINTQLEIVLKELFSFQDSNYLFADYDGNLLDTNVISAKISFVCKRSKLKFNLYMLRHLFSTDLIESATDSRTIMELLGHADYQMSISYARSKLKNKEKAIMDRKLS